jgi:ankyrin repeat protein
MPNLFDFCISGDLMALKKWLKPDSEISDNEKTNLLIYACEFGHFDIVRYLIEDIKVDINSKNNFGHVPIIEASASGRLDIVKYLFYHDAALDIADYNGKTALMSSVHHPEVFRWLLPLVDNINKCDNSGRSVLYYLGRAVGEDSQLYKMVSDALLLLNEEVIVSGDNIGFE